METTRPQYLEALSAAREFCNKIQETVILFYDEDIDPNFLQYRRLSTWERMLDNGQVEESWIFGDMQPK